jgi:hypothetical protein
MVQSWIFAMHSSRFKKAGDYFKLEIAGFPFILIMGKDGVINGFHTFVVIEPTQLSIKPREAPQYLVKLSNNFLTS